MKTTKQWFTEYNVSHRNSTNKLIHFICVPAIFFSVIALGLDLHFTFLDAYLPTFLQPFVSLGGLLILGGLLFYFQLSKPIFLFMLLAVVLCAYISLKLQQAGINFEVALSIFVVAWIGQFIGHKIEGAKPSFFKDLQFLFVGPAWCVSFLYEKLGIRY